MTDFKIKRGLSTTIFTSPGIINPRLVIEEGVWYLCTDTAALYFGIVDTDGHLTLKKVNGQDFADLDTSLTTAIQELKDSLITLEETKLYKKIERETDLPSDFTSEDFNPNITYYIQVADGRVNTYIFDVDAQCYMSTSNVDDLVIRAMVTTAIEENLKDTLDETLNDAINAILPDAIKESIEYTILYGGNAESSDKADD